MVIVFWGSLFESNLLNTPPDEISGIKKDTQLIWPNTQSKLEVLHLNMKVTKDYHRALSQNVTVEGSIHKHFQGFSSGRKS